MVLSVGLDITERKQAEQALQRLHGQLEIRVRKHTQQLAEANNYCAMKSPTHMANDGLAVRTDELRRSEKSLRSQTDILQSILYSMAAGVIVGYQDGKLLLSNPAAQRPSGNNLTQLSLSNPRCAINP